MSRHGNRVLVGVIVGVSVTVATLTAAMMGQPADITSDTGYAAQGSVESSATDQAPTEPTEPTEPSTVHTYGPDASTETTSAETNNDVVEIACFTTEDSDLAGCDFDPHKRYDYVDGAWTVVPADTIYANGNRPPTGAKLNAIRDGTYDAEVKAGS